jgi:hypothetical protein
MFLLFMFPTVAGVIGVCHHTQLFLLRQVLLKFVFVPAGLIAIHWISASHIARITGMSHEPLGPGLLSFMDTILLMLLLTPPFLLYLFIYIFISISWYSTLLGMCLFLLYLYISIISWSLIQWAKTIAIVIHFEAPIVLDLDNGSPIKLLASCILLKSFHHF